MVPHLEMLVYHAAARLQAVFFDDMYKIQKRKVLIWTQLLFMSNFRLGRMNQSLFGRDGEAIFSVINGTSPQ